MIVFIAAFLGSLAGSIAGFWFVSREPPGLEDEPIQDVAIPANRRIIYGRRGEDEGKG